ncbi:NADH-ubiquinone oxidoreductase chain 5 [Trachymyrmex septentrionalis]|uniref:NADH-ubiquinone oxidoreductase chain 5 n=1 Tax=Trachymyrmex septentrionalis TaxID=34720 RepID=A0A151JU70_9HYME|nr:NADH-ubiquinone oxidoreductase chain 5 [Trachymyrmex septentrionalis]
MVIRPNVVRILVGWDGLEIVSYCLIIYYQNYSSYNSDMITVLYIVNVVEHIRNVDPKQFANIRDEVLKEMDVDFEEIMNQDSDEEVLSDDTGCVSDLNELDTDHAEKFVSSPEIRALNGRTKHCIIQCYYTTGGALNVCSMYDTFG